MRRRKNISQHITVYFIIIDNKNCVRNNYFMHE